MAIFIPILFAQIVGTVKRCKRFYDGKTHPISIKSLDTFRTTRHSEFNQSQESFSVRLTRKQCIMKFIEDMSCHAMQCHAMCVSVKISQLNRA